MNQSVMTHSERHVALSLAGIYSLRMLGLFMIFPVFALYARHLDGTSPMLIGLALGAYGLTQALLQIPFGMLSDRFGRKPVIAVGLFLFAAGSVVAALSHHIVGVIVGRALQGSGAIASAVMALAADLTRDEQRTKVMALIGVSIGLSFAVALVVGPILNSMIGVPGIFWLTSLLALAGIAALLLLVPSPTRSQPHLDAEAVRGQFWTVLADGQLLRLDAGILILHFILTATFVVLPIALRDVAHFPADRHWQIYLGVLAGSVAIMVPFIIVAERRQMMKQVMAGAVLVLALAEFGLGMAYHTVLGIVAALLAFFGAFNILEASLPSLISKLAPADRKGTALGVYSSSQFLGAFLGGSLGGWLYGRYGFEVVFESCAALGAVWLALVVTMRRPRPLSSYILTVGSVDEGQARQLAERLARLKGVAEAVVIREEGVAYLKVDRNLVDETALHQAAAAQA